MSAAHTDLGDEYERASEYFDEGEWKWNEMVRHARFIHQFHSTDDPLIPVEEARYVAQNLQSAAESAAELSAAANEDGSMHGPTASFKYDELQGFSHFFDPFRPLLDVLDRFADATAATPPAAPAPALALLLAPRCSQPVPCTSH